MTVKQQFLIVQNDVIRTLDNRFVKYLDATLTIKYSGMYPQQYEDLLLSGTYNSQIKVNNLLYNPYSDEFFEVSQKIDFPREYIIKFSFVHNYCFEMFCMFFELLANGISDETAMTYLNEYKYFLNVQTTTTNTEYNESYSRYWREIIMRVMMVIQQGSHVFYNRFTEEQRKVILEQLSPIENKLNPN